MYSRDRVGLVRRLVEQGATNHAKGATRNTPQIQATYLDVSTWSTTYSYLCRSRGGIRMPQTCPDEADDTQVPLPVGGIHRFSALLAGPNIPGEVGIRWNLRATPNGLGL
jgi:hypothetical protein